LRRWQKKSESLRRRTILSNKIKAALKEALLNNPSVSLAGIRGIVEAVVGESLEFGERRKFFHKVLQKHFPTKLPRRVQRQKVSM